MKIILFQKVHATDKIRFIALVLLLFSILTASAQPKPTKKEVPAQPVSEKIPKISKNGKIDSLYNRSMRIEELLKLYLNTLSVKESNPNGAETTAPQPPQVVTSNTNNCDDITKMYEKRQLEDSIHLAATNVELTKMKTGMKAWESMANKIIASEVWPSDVMINTIKAQLKALNTGYSISVDLDQLLKQGNQLRELTDFLFKGGDVKFFNNNYPALNKTSWQEKFRAQEEYWKSLKIKANDFKEKAEWLSENINYFKDNTNANLRKSQVETMTNSELIQSHPYLNTIFEKNKVKHTEHGLIFN